MKVQPILLSLYFSHSEISNIKRLQTFILKYETHKENKSVVVLALPTFSPIETAAFHYQARATVCSLDADYGTDLRAMNLITEIR